MSGTPDMRRELHFGDRVLACYADRPHSVLEILQQAVARYPDREALVHDDRRLTYAQLDREVAAVAAGLARLGVGQGDRVAMLLGNGIPFVVVTYAAARLGAVTVPMSIRDQMPGIRHAITNSQAKALIVESEFAPLVPPGAETPDLQARIVVGPAVERKMGVAAMGTLAIDARSWKSADWASEHGLFAEVFEDADTMDQTVERLAKPAPVQRASRPAFHPLADQSARQIMPPIGNCRMYEQLREEIALRVTAADPVDLIAHRREEIDNAAVLPLTRGNDSAAERQSNIPKNRPLRRARLCRGMFHRCQHLGDIRVPPGTGQRHDIVRVVEDEKMVVDVLRANLA